MKTGSDGEFQSCKLPASVIQMPCTSASGSAILMASTSVILMPCTSDSASAILMARVILLVLVLVLVLF